MRQNWQMWSGGLSDEDLSTVLLKAAKLKPSEALRYE